MLAEAIPLHQASQPLVQCNACCKCEKILGAVIPTWSPGMVTLRHLKRASETPNHQLLGTPSNRSHDVSVYETCVIHTNLLSNM